MRIPGRDDRTQLTEPEPNTRGAAFWCLAWCFVLALGLVGVALTINLIVATGRLPNQEELVGDAFRFAFTVFASGMAGLFGARWALVRGKRPEGTVAKLARVSWIVCWLGLGLMMIVFVYGVIVCVFMSHGP